MKIKRVNRAVKSKEVKNALVMKYQCGSYTIDNVVLIPLKCSYIIEGKLKINMFKYILVYC